MMILKVLSLGFVVFLSGMARAQQVQIGAIQLSGAGCPSGTASVTLSPDSSVASILFSAFEITKDSTNPWAKTLQKSCSVVLPIQVPANYVLVSWKVDYRGYVHIEDPMTAFSFVSKPQLTSFQRFSYPPQVTTFGGVRDQEVEFSQNIRTQTGCGSRVNLQVEMQMTLSTQQGMHQQQIRGNAMTSIDSADESVSDPQNERGMHFHFGLLPCR
jgi:hypothetical protein